MKRPSLTFLITATILLWAVAQFLPLMLTEGLTKQLFGFPVPYASERLFDTSSDVRPYPLNDFRPVWSLVDAVFLFILCLVIWLWQKESRAGEKISSFQRDFLTVVLLGILAIAALFYLREDALWEELAHGDDPCYARIDGKSPTYLLKNGLVCTIYYETAYGASYFKILPGADAATFVDLGDGCGKDKNHVYCGEEIQTFLDAGKFHELENGYATDGRFLMYYGRLVPDADPASLTVLPGKYFAKDARRVYRNGAAFEGADPASFSVVSDDAELSKDENHVYYADRIVPDADPATFIHIGKRFARDKRRVYCNGEPLPELDVSTYLPVGTSDYLRDEDSLYYCAKKVEGADPTKFTIRPASKETENGMFSVSTDTCGTDGTVVVCHGEVQDGANPETYFNMSESEKYMLDVFDHSN